MNVFSCLDSQDIQKILLSSFRANFLAYYVFKYICVSKGSVYFWDNPDCVEYSESSSCVVLNA